MPRLRYFPTDELDQFALRVDRAKDPDEDNHLADAARLRHRSILSRAARLVGSLGHVDSLIEDAALGRSLRQIAAKGDKSAASICRHRKKLRFAVMAVNLHDGVNSRGGATIDPATGFELRLKSGYLVSIKAYSHSFNRCPQPIEIVEWLAAHHLATDQLYPGIWTSLTTGKYWLDLNKQFQDIDAAWCFGCSQGEEAIFDLAKRNSIYVPERRAA